MTTADRVHWTLANVFLLFALQFAWAAVPLVVEPADHQQLQSQVLQLLRQVRAEETYDTAVVYRHEAGKAQNCIFPDLVVQMDTAVVLVNRQFGHALNARFSSALLVLICASYVDAAFAQKNLQIFQGRHTARHIVYAPHHRNNNTLVRDFCQALHALEIHNALIIQRDFATTDTYHACRTFPSTSAQPYVARALNSSALMFANQFLNMHGAPIYTYSDQRLPHIMLYYDRDGHLQMGGYLGKLLTAYAAHHNATLLQRYPVQLGQATSNEVLQQAAANGSLDIAACLANALSVHNFSAMTYPYEIISLCFMVPLPQAVPLNRLFTSIVRPPILVFIFLLIVIYALLLGHSTRRQLSFVDVLLSDKAIRGMLGQTFTLMQRPSLKTKFICFLLCYTSLLINTTYQAYLQSFLTNPPLLPFVNTYQDMEAAGIKVLFDAREFEKITSDPANAPLLQYQHIVEKVEHIKDFLQRRSVLDIRYAYPVSSASWLVFDEQQSLYNRKLFYYSDEHCMNKFLILGLPLRPNLPYRELFERFILRIHAAGIMEMWMSINFYDMVRLNLTNLEDLSGDVNYGKPLTLEDFRWIWALYGLCVTLSLLGFVGETIQWRRQGKRQSSVKQKRREKLRK